MDKKSILLVVIGGLIALGLALSLATAAKQKRAKQAATSPATTQAVAAPRYETEFALEPGSAKEPLCRLTATVRSVDSGTVLCTPTLQARWGEQAAVDWTAPDGDLRVYVTAEVGADGREATCSAVLSSRGQRIGAQRTTVKLIPAE